ncbi:MAG: zinc metalloprotease [Dinghuibacter sp.]|nr:zinc metalloprotease [Dinghuibacter sp.]
MKRIAYAFALATLFGLGCNKSDNNEGSINEEAASFGAADQRSCSAAEVLEEQMKADPARRRKMDEIEAFTQRFASNPNAARLLPDGTIEIPVVFNVIYNLASENISAAQLQSQIDVLNEDFGATNADYNNTPALFQPVRSGNTNIRFVLDATIRKFNSKTSWRTNDDMKFASKGGIDASSPTTKLNIWVVNRMTSAGRTILGYAQFPGGPTATDGVVLGHNFTGRTGVLAANYNKGRTATHEVGHWLNLRHIWGDATCGNDQVGDTPLHNTSNGGCPAYPHLSTCAGTPVEMTMNYMDYTYDACMYMFSAGQKTRMLATFAVGGPRNSFAQP